MSDPNFYHVTFLIGIENDPGVKITTPVSYLLNVKAHCKVASSEWMSTERVGMLQPEWREKRCSMGVSRPLIFFKKIERLMV
jgi:hypothetical protein